MKRSLGFLTVFTLALAVSGSASASSVGSVGGGGNKDKDRAKSARPVGHVVQATSALVDQAELNVGTTLYNGDTVDTKPDGSMHATVRSSQIALPNTSSATLEECTDELHILVNEGTVVFTASASDHVELIIAQGIVKPQDGQSASGQISIVSPREAIVTATHGSLVRR